MANPFFVGFVSRILWLIVFFVWVTGVNLKPYYFSTLMAGNPMSSISCLSEYSIESYISEQNLIFED